MSLIRDEDQLLTIFPYCRHPADWLRPLNQAFDRFEINTPERIAAFLGQIGYESGELNNVQENLNYSARRLVAVWPTRFADLEAARPYSRNPEKLANKVYADRLGNGPEHTGDGFRFRGRGLIQITGRDNYVRVGGTMDLPGIVEMPDSLLEPRYAALSAAAYWHERDLNSFADHIEDDNLETIVKAITRKVNGGEHGLEQRMEYTKRALGTLQPRQCAAPDDWLDEVAKELA